MKTDQQTEPHQWMMEAAKRIGEWVSFQYELSLPIGPAGDDAIARIIKSYAPDDGWLPMESAPQTGVVILAWERGGGLTLISYAPPSEHSDPAYVWYDDSERGYRTSGAFVGWRPIPSQQKGVSDGMEENQIV